MNLVLVIGAFTLFLGYYHDFGVEGVALEIDLRLTDEQKKVMDKVIH